MAPQGDKGTEGVDPNKPGSGLGARAGVAAIAFVLGLGCLGYGGYPALTGGPVSLPLVVVGLSCCAVAVILMGTAGRR